MRDVTPAAADAPTEPDVVPIAGAPTRPDSIVASPLAASPPRITCMSGRCHLASLIFCTVVRSPMARSDDAIAATANGTIMLTAKTGQPRSDAGNAMGPAPDGRNAASGVKPSANAAT